MTMQAFKFKALYIPAFLIAISTVFVSCTKKEANSSNTQASISEHMENRKVVVYQVFTRLFGNTNTHNKPWGTMEENGVGKFEDFTDQALDSIKGLGVTHIWYTGVPHHDVIRDYTKYGISLDDPDVVKGRAGSPYAVKDYYNVNPDLASDPAKRLEEFEALIERSHKHQLKVIIDIVPNHVARNYHSLSHPSFGEKDDVSKEYARDNNFYYTLGQAFQVPVHRKGYQALGGDKHPLLDGKFDENPAKWTGNGSRKAQPDENDWYETVKVNYGVRPDGSKDFDSLPENYAQMPYKSHYAFWQDKSVPDSWKKFRDIALFWLDKGVDGFRYDMAEMVPVEFWSYLNSSIKMKNPKAFLVAEVYNPSLYRDYIFKGKMDYLYDKVAMYDTLKMIMQGRAGTAGIVSVQKEMADIEHHMLHFLENHDEQRIASPEFAGDARKGMPAMVVSATISTSPTMLYFGQAEGEPGAEDAGFGSHSRTSIFDYVGVPHHQHWMNGGQFDGGQFSDEEKALHDFYKRLLNFTITSKALMGKYEEINTFNSIHTEWYDPSVFSFVRWTNEEHLIIVSNFNADHEYGFDLRIPAEIISNWKLQDGNYPLNEMLYAKDQLELKVINGEGRVSMRLQAVQSLVLKLE